MHVIYDCLSAKLYGSFCHSVFLFVSVLYICIVLFLTVLILAACYLNQHPAWSVHPMVCLSVSQILLFYVSYSLTSLLLPNSLVTSNMAPTHPRATGVVVYPAFFSSSVSS